MLRHNEWASMDGQVCLVTSFTPLATAENGAVVSVSKGTPYASVQLLYNAKISLKKKSMGTLLIRPTS